MPRPERDLNPDAGEVQKFAYELRELRQQAGATPYRQLAQLAHFSATTLADAAGGRRLPSLAVALAYVRACGGDESLWEARWREAAYTPEELEPAASAPYVGLGCFQTRDADRFFGRSRAVGELHALVSRRRLTAVVGASGCGKSSLLRAGLLGRTEGPATVLTPRADPIQECSVHLAALTGGSAASWRDDLAADPANLHLRAKQAMARDDGDLLLVIDQFEEVVTLCTEQQRAWLTEAVLHAAQAEDSRVRAVLGIRADFYGHGLLRPELAEALRGGHILLGPMSPSELREAITAPAVRGGYQVETDLVARIVADGVGQPGALPLVSHALAETWRRRQGMTLTLAGYEAAGGVQHALARTAENVYTTLAPAQQAVARELFLRLIALGEGTQDTKRRVELADDPGVTAVVEKLTGARLLVVDHGGVELIHEALIQHWPRLRGWLAEDREDLRVYRHVVDATASWRALGCDPGSLYRGARLELAREWLTRAPGMVTSHEREFLEASVAVQARDQLDTQRRHRQLRWLAAGLAVLLLVTAVALVVAARQRDEAVLKGKIAVSQRLATEAREDSASDTGKAIRLSLDAFTEHQGEESRSSLLSIAAHPNHHGRIRQPGEWGSTGIAVSPDGALLASPEGNQVTLRDTRTAKQVGTFALPNSGYGWTSKLVFGPDGRTLVGSSSDSYWRDLVVWDVVQRRALTHHRHREIRADKQVTAFSADTSMFATSTSRAITVLELGRGTVVATLQGVLSVSALSFSPDRRLLASLSEDSIVLWDLRTAAPAVTIPVDHNSVSAVAFSPDGRTLATAGANGVITLLDTASGARQATLTRHNDAVQAMAFDGSGQTLASTGGNAVVLWDVPRREHLVELPTSEPIGPHDIAMSHDGSTIAHATRGSVLLWDRRRLPLLGTPDSPDLRYWRVAIRADGRGVVAAPDNGPVMAWDDQRRLITAAPAVSSTRMWQNVLSPDGHRTADLSDNHLIVVSGTASGERITELPQPPTEPPVAAAFSPDGTKLAVAYKPMAVVVWDLATRQRTAEFVVGFAGTLRFTADSTKIVASSHSSAAVEVWDLHGHRQVFHVDSAGPGEASADGSLFVTPEADGRLTFWDVLRGWPIATAAGHTGNVNAMSLSPDGRLLATAGQDRRIILWDTATRTRWATLTGHTQAIQAIGWSVDSRTLASLGSDRTIRLWTVDTDQAVKQLCGSHGRYDRPATEIEPAVCR
ncbi:helix-turn-helix domain-containing protein [Kibdelosporangium phytohabitans]|uniref:HTH cro/C1-type domain-containing protein n=1 Tax=Kibdelosporangium phytohabitans TaxID=860235 RepID=A0A0N9I0X9_9PSEU|nr:helix-turn-helix domain-containing protein [Kibdelosporangium phytohabitans]ALG09477.1 hypothetical protein AOZ06_23500 [Kibdelosporangium phytohabitans]MBE1469227.1 WD40 repeat protein [Kibdelosporangium phytohabitans]